MNEAPYYRYWGKARPNDVGGASYHLLPYHCLDVAAVAYWLLSPKKRLLQDICEYLGVSTDEFRSLFVFCVALHDLGKFASAFQGLYHHNSDKLIKANCRKEYDGRNYRHDRMGWYFWNIIKKSVFNEFLIGDSFSGGGKDLAQDNFAVLMELVLGHHGQPIDTSSVRAVRHFTETHNETAAVAFFTDLYNLYKPALPLEKFACKEFKRRLEFVSWQLAGLTVLADWVGSDQSHFKFQSNTMPLADYWPIALERAEAALKATELENTLKVKPFRSIKQHYGYEPTPLQQWAESVELDDSPQLFILEDITGAGKTEAALALTHRLMDAGAATGFYFGLPTMATSNAMFSRVAEHYQQMLASKDGKPSIVLAHGAREMNDMFQEAVLSANNPDSEYNPDDKTATAQCNRWLADSRKKALLAPVGVGTIDQALLAVLPRRHQSLRLLGLHNKVLIFDEVHAADEYMFELLESLLALHLRHGGSAILLTATLSQKQRSRLVSIWQENAGLTPQPIQHFAFPLATKVAVTTINPVQEYALQSRADVSRSVKVTFLHTMDACIERILNATDNGQCVVWVRNSVDDALDAYRQISEKMAKPEDCLLFHSRFVLADRKRIEEKVLAILGKGSNSTIRACKVLIATQVFQESLDADADLMISDICPIDDLIQRAGRLHRHTRDNNRKYQHGIKDHREQPHLLVHAPEWEDLPAENWLSREFRNTQFVYRSPGRLWLGMRELIRLGGFAMPENARQLIEAVYSDSANEEIPESLIEAENKYYSESRAKAAIAASKLIDWQRYGYSMESARAWYEDLTDISTRHSDIETVEVLLLRKTESGVEPWVNEANHSIALSKVKLSKNKYADKLAPIPAELEEVVERFQKENKQAAYVQCWLPENDTHYRYDESIGFIELVKEAK